MSLLEPTNAAITALEASQDRLHEKSMQREEESNEVAVSAIEAEFLEGLTRAEKDESYKDITLLEFLTNYCADSEKFTDALKALEPALDKVNHDYHFDDKVQTFKDNQGD